MSKRISLLGSTGSIGRQTLDVIDACGMEVAAITANSSVDRLEEQARVLGAGPLTAFRRVTLPNLLPVILSAFSMSYIVSFSQYFLTLIIGGGNVKTFTIVMVPFLTGGERNFASIYSVIFLMVTIVIFGVFELVTRRIMKNRDVEYFS